MAPGWLLLQAYFIESYTEGKIEKGEREEKKKKKHIFGGSPPLYWTAAAGLGLRKPAIVGSYDFSFHRNS
jgi:hypothetical protein